MLRRRRTRAASYVLVVRGIAILAVAAIKHAVGRARPVLEHPLAAAGGASFPSGHACGAAALWGSVALLVPGPRWRRLALATVVPALVAATRVLIGVHYLSDVVAGLLLGWGLAWAGAVAVRASTPDSPSIARVHEGERRMNGT
jgi:membrane-associated phospholipid phosphatase